MAKSAENHEKTKKREKNSDKKLSGVKNLKAANRPKRIFLKFRADRSQVRLANERSNFEFLSSNTFEYVRIQFSEASLRLRWGSGDVSVMQ